MSGKLTIQTLGGLEIRLNSTPITRFDQKKVPALLVYLACTGRAHPRDVLAEMFWPDRPRGRALSNLGAVITHLRQFEPYISAPPRQPPVMNPDADWWLDVDAFETQLDAASDQDVGILEAALDLYQGDFLAGFFVESDAFEDWARQERERFKLRAMEGLARLVTAHLNQQDYSAGVVRARQLLQMDPLREVTHQRLMVLLARSGQRGAALEQYAIYQQILADELGVEPLPETVALYDCIRAGELGEIPAGVAPKDAAAVEIIPALLTNPYKGLYAFEEADAADYFGRDVLIERLLERLGDNDEWSCFLAVVGPSGSGKSSAIRAGVIPALRVGALPSSEDWTIIAMLPGSCPLDELAIMLQRAFPDAPAALIDDLHRDERGLLRAVRSCLSADSQTVLLVIDQFEEVFTQVEDEAEARGFLDSLYIASTTPRSPIRILITLRADFYDRPLMIPDFSELVRQRTEVVTPMTPEELERAIAGPAERVRVRVEPELVAAVVADVAHQPGALPMMEYALTELFDRREDGTLTLGAYRELGGASGALARRADDVYARLTTDRQIAARQLFLRLVTLGEGSEDTRRRARQAELLSAGGSAMYATLHAFDRSRLLTFDLDPTTGQPLVELAHEAVIREWGQLRVWLDESRHDIRQQRTLAASAREWFAHNRDRSYLLHGSRLTQFDEWAATASIALTRDERDFLSTSITEHHAQRARQRRARNMILGAALLVTIVMTVLALFALNAQSDAEDQRDHSRREAEVRQSVALAANAKEALAVNNTDLAIALALEAYAIDDPPIEAEQALAAAVYSPGTRQVLLDHEDSVNTIAVSPDGRYALSGGGRSAFQIIRGTDLLFSDEVFDYQLRLWDLETGTLVRRLDGHTDTVWDIAFTPDGQRAVSGSMDGSAIVWNIETGEIIHRLELFEGIRVYSLAIRPDGKQVALGHRSTLVSLWNLDTGENERIVEREFDFQDNLRIVWSVAYSPDGRYLVTGQGRKGYDTNGWVTLWDLATNELVWVQKVLGTVRSVAFHPTNAVVYASAYDVVPGTAGRGFRNAMMIEYDLRTGVELRQFRHGWNPLTELAISPDGQTGVTASADQMLILWSLETGAVIRYLAGHTDMITSTAYATNGKLVSGSEDGSIRVWDLYNGAEVRRFIGAVGRVSLAEFNRDGTQLITGGSGGQLYVWDVDSGAQIHRMIGHINTPACVGLTLDAQTLFSGSNVNGEILRWNMETGESLGWPYLSPIAAWSCTVSSDGRYMLVSPGSDKLDTPSQLEIWYIDLQTGETIRRLTGHTALVYDTDISPDGQYALSSSEDNTLRYWNLWTGEVICLFEDQLGTVGAVEFSPDGRYALADSGDKTIVLRDLKTCEEVRRFEGHSQTIHNIAFSPDGRTALSISEDRVMIFWDVATGEEIRRFEGHFLIGWDVAFSPDGRLAASGGEGGEIILWRLTDSPEEIIAWAYENRYVRELTCTEREAYNVFPLCDAQGQFPTRTPFPTPTASQVPSVTPTLDLTQITATPTWTPWPSNTPLPTNSPAPTPAPVGRGNIMFGVPFSGSVHASSSDVWTFEGMAGESITIINVNFDIAVELIDPNGELIGDSETNLGPVQLPVTGTYSVIVKTGSGGFGAYYTLTVTEK